MFLFNLLTLFLAVSAQHVDNNQMNKSYYTNQNTPKASSVLVPSVYQVPRASNMAIAPEPDYVVSAIQYVQSPVTQSPPQPQVQTSPQVQVQPQPVQAARTQATQHMQSQTQRDDRLAPGDVFGLITLSNNPNINQDTVVIYKDGTLGVDEPNSPGYLFQGVLFDEYNLLVVPEPFANVKLHDNGVYFVNDSLFNPAPMFSSKGWTLETHGGHSVVCPSWNSVLVYVQHNTETPCSDAIEVDLGIVPITLD